jgi:hypothetical protein
MRVLDRLLSEADTAVPVDDWRGSVLRRAKTSEPPVSLANQLLSADAVTRRGAADRDGWVYLATPLHARASMTSVHLPADGCIDLDSVAAQRLAADFATVFEGSGWELIAGRSARMFLWSERAMDVRTFDPMLALGTDIQPWLAQGVDASRLRAIGSEIEMWLFAHPVNQVRQANGQAAITTLWPWADGAVDGSAAPIPLALLGRDALLAACIDARAGANLKVHAPVEPGSPDWTHIESEWLPARARELRGGEIGFITLSCGPIEYTVRRFTRITRWRRLRPWWEYF